MKSDTISNILSEHRLTDKALEFLNGIKFEEYHLETLNKFEIIQHVNNSPNLVRKILGSQMETGFCDTFKIKPNDNSESFKSFEALNNKRKSIRQYSGEEMSFEQLSNFLHLFYIITGSEEFEVHGEKMNRTRRNIASGGSLYPTEVYIACLNIKDLPPGVYRYNVFQGELESIIYLDSEDKKEKFYSSIMHKEGRKANIDFDNANFYLLFTSVINKQSFKYEDFGLFLSFVEIGEFIHSAYLSAAQTNLGCCPFGGILHDQTQQLLKIKNSLHKPFVAMSFGTIN